MTTIKFIRRALFHEVRDWIPEPTFYIDMKFRVRCPLSRIFFLINHFLYLTTEYRFQKLYIIKCENVWRLWMLVRNKRMWRCRGLLKDALPCWKLSTYSITANSHYRCYTWISDGWNIFVWRDIRHVSFSSYWQIDGYTSPPPIKFFFYEGTITQVLSCTLHMLNTVTSVATGVLIGLVRPVMHSDAGYNGWFGRWGRGRIHCLQSVQLCIQTGLKWNKKGKGSFQKERGKRDTEELVFECVCRLVSLYDELHAGCWKWRSRFIGKKFLVVLFTFVMFLYIKSVNIVRCWISELTALKYT